MQKIDKQSDYDRETKQHINQVVSALKSRPMRRLRGLCKRKFGTAPSILGTYGKRSELADTAGSLSFVSNIEINCDDLDETDINIFAPGEFIVFRGTDGYDFNIIQLTEAYGIQNLHPKSKIKGNFLVQVAEDDIQSPDVMFHLDPQWIGGSMLFKDVLRDRFGNIAVSQWMFILLRMDNSSNCREKPTMKLH